MPNTANRKRSLQVKFFVDENELAAIKQRMTEFWIDDFSTYLHTSGNRCALLANPKKRTIFL